MLMPVREGTAWAYGDHVVWPLEGFIHVGRYFEDVIAKVKKRRVRGFNVVGAYVGVRTPWFLHRA